MNQFNKFGFEPINPMSNPNLVDPLKPISTPNFIPQTNKFGFEPIHQENKVLESPQENDIELEKDIERQQARLTSRGLETALGLPGDIESFGRYLFGVEPKTLLPTSGELKEKSEKLSQGYTKPKNESEEQLDEVFQDFVGMALPGAGKYSMARNIGIPIVANLAKEGIKYAGAKEGNQAAAKIGTMLALDLMTHNKGGAKKYASGLFEEAKKTIPKGQSINATNLVEKLNILEAELSKGGNATSKTRAFEKISELKKDVKNGKIDVQNLYEYRPVINEAISELGGFDIKVNPAIRKKAISNLQNVKDVIAKELETYGNKVNPEFLKFYKPANEAYAVYENSNKITKALQKTIGNLKSEGAKILFGAGSTLGVGALAPGIAKAAAPLAIPAAAIYQSYKIFHRVKNSPTLRKYYGDVIKNTLSGNIAEATINLNRLDKELINEPISNR